MADSVIESQKANFKSLDSRRKEARSRIDANADIENVPPPAVLTDAAVVP